MTPQPPTMSDDLEPTGSHHEWRAPTAGDPPDAERPTAHRTRQEDRVSYRGRDNPRQVREAAFGALYEALTDRPAAEFTSRRTTQVPDGVDWQDPDQLAALSAAATPRRLVRLTYPVIGCTCAQAGIPGEHIHTSRCPPPAPELIEASDDGGRTWRTLVG